MAQTSTGEVTEMGRSDSAKRLLSSRWSMLYGSSVPSRQVLHDSHVPATAYYKVLRWSRVTSCETLARKS